MKTQSLIRPRPRGSGRHSDRAPGSLRKLHAGFASCHEPLEAYTPLFSQPIMSQVALPSSRASCHTTCIMWPRDGYGGYGYDAQSEVHSLTSSGPKAQPFINLLRSLLHALPSVVPVKRVEMFLPRMVDHGRGVKR